MKRKLIYTAIALMGFAILGFIFGEKFLINGIVGAVMAGLVWLFAIEPQRLKEKIEQEKATSQKLSSD